MRDRRDPRVEITTVATYVDDRRTIRWGTGALGMVHAAVLVALRRTDVLHVHLAHRGSVVRKAVPLLVARLARVPAVVHGHSFDFAGWFDGLGRVGQALVRAALPADRWLILGDGLAAEYRRCLRLRPDQVRVLRNPVQMPATVPARPDETHVRAVCFGRFGERKGSYDLVRAIVRMDPVARARFTVVAAGDGEVEQVRREAEHHAVTDVLTVRDWIEPAERDALFAASEVFVLPSHAEGVPMALLEAMSWGLVPVTCPVGGIPEVVQDGVDCVLVPPGDPGALAAALDSVVLDADRRHAIAAGARSRAGDYTVDWWFGELIAEWTALANRA